MAKRTKKTEAKKETIETVTNIIFEGKVYLVHPKSKEQLPFNPDHALNIMSMEKNGGWTFALPGASVEQLKTEMGEITATAESEEDCGCGKK